MELDKFLQARAVVNEDATLHGEFFGNAPGLACAIGGLYISIHPDLEWEEYQKLQELQIIEVVKEEFGLTSTQVSSIISENDSVAESEPFPYEPEDFTSYGGPDPDGYANALEIWENNHDNDEELIELRRARVIEQMALFLTADDLKSLGEHR